MKNNIKRFVTSIIAIGIIISSLLMNITAVSLEDNIEELNDFSIYQEAEKIINLYKTEQIDFTIVGDRLLYDLTGTPKFTFYELAPYGYAILLNVDNSLLEACYADVEVCELLLNGASPIIYCGPNNYLTHINSNYYDLLSGELVSSEELDAFSTVVNSLITNKELELESKNLISINSNEMLNDSPVIFGDTVVTSVEYDYFSNLVKYGKNLNNTCTVIAISILLGYYDNYINDDYVGTVFEDGNGTTEGFHQTLNHYVYGSGEQGGIFIHDAIVGVNDFLNNSGFHSELISVNSNQTTVINTIINQLGAGQPVVASMGSHLGAEYDHSVLIYKVVYDSLDPSGTAVFTMNMGWNSTDSAAFVCSAGWFYECGYLTNINHEYSNWNQLARVHNRTCMVCSAVQSEAHNMVANNGITSCSECGKVQTSDGPVILG